MRAFFCARCWCYSAQRRMIANFKQYGRLYLYLLGMYAVLILIIWQNNPDKTAGETLVFAIELPFLIPYIFVVDLIPQFIREMAVAAQGLVFLALWLGFIGGVLCAVVWFVGHLLRAVRHKPH